MITLADFFTYTSHYRTGVYHDLNTFEWLFPIFVLFVLIYFLFKYKDTFKNNKLLDKRLRISIGLAFTILYLSHYLLRYAIYGYDTLILPFQLCSISMFLAIILIFTRNRTIYTFVLFTGVAGGLISLFVPIIGYDSNYYRYYQYMLAHGILIITPLYFLAVYGFYPSKRETIYAYIMAQVAAKFMLVFNYFMGTDFMFLFLDPNKANKFPIINDFGGIPLYLIWIELVTIIWFVLAYLGITFLKNKRN